MISICIPIYNYDVTILLDSLCEQLSRIETAVEIILIDDGSEKKYKVANKPFAQKHIYIQLDKNIGRAAIRNRFLQYAQYDYLLFLDCDSLLPSSEFLSTYVKSAQQKQNSVICGGRIYPSQQPSRNKRLRWKYGIEKESQTKVERNRNPNQSFMTNNFLIEKELFQSIQFNEQLTDYGHEDTLFGFQLKKNNIEIHHIDMPVLNGDIEENEKFMQQTEKSIGNLVFILQQLQYDKSFIKDVRLLNTYYKFLTIKGVISTLFHLFGGICRKLLANGYVNLSLFDFYKLGYLTLEMDKIGLQKTNN